LILFITQFLTSDLEDSFSSTCFNLSAGKRWSTSAPSIAIGILTSEVKLNKVCQKSFEVIYLTIRMKNTSLPLISSSDIGPG